jgi:hypothetical protein
VQISEVTLVQICKVLNHLFLENMDKIVGLQIASKGGIKLIVVKSVLTSAIVWAVLNRLSRSPKL